MILEEMTQMKMLKKQQWQMIWLNQSQKFKEIYWNDIDFEEMTQL